MTTPNLLPCPFCGHDSPQFERLGDRRQSCIVVCGNCGCRHESSDEGANNGDSWNYRSDAVLQEANDRAERLEATSFDEFNKSFPSLKELEGLSDADACRIAWDRFLDRKQRRAALAALPADRERMVLVPMEPTPEIIAAAAIAVWPTASEEDIAIARKAAPIVLMKYDLDPSVTLEEVAAILATMAPAYRAMIAAAPSQSNGTETQEGKP